MDYMQLIDRWVAGNGRRPSGLCLRTVYFDRLQWVSELLDSASRCEVPMCGGQGHVIDDPSA